MIDFDIRPLTEREDLKSVVRLQRQIWGFEDVDLIPLRLFVVASKIGGQVYGAFDGELLIGFCMAIPGLKPGGKTYLHSHMLGVLPEYRNSGIGRILKVTQRNDAIARGIDLIEWTFDPLELKNAFFNMERLGAIVRRYVPNQYGTTSSPLHGGLPTDRCIAEWWISSPRVTTRLAGGYFAHYPAEARIAIPSDIATIRANDPASARQIQQKACEQLCAAFDRGLAVIGFEKSEEAGTYLLGQWESA
ncbi:MAG TPA: GNAT family N-acetyltransferase [Bryobacteraceae bacterium]|jgi:predicted GNAT superfamily acetyltransferase|nr:GNAT family N-acetyltransferase [Bryobacteraceae bacterium]